MAIHIRSEDGKVTIDADDGSTVRDIYVDGREVSGLSVRRRFPWRTLGIVLIIVVALGLLLFPALCPASPLDCLDIKDNDARHFCLAVSKHDKLECEFIHNHDKRAECRALAGAPK